MGVLKLHRRSQRRAKAPLDAAHGVIAREPLINRLCRLVKFGLLSVPIVPHSATEIDSPVSVPPAVARGETDRQDLDRLVHAQFQDFTLKEENALPGSLKMLHETVDEVAPSPSIFRAAAEPQAARLIENRVVAL